MELEKQDKLKLIEFFGYLLDKEIDKPLGEMNSEAVDNYLKILHNLYDIHIETSQEFINEQVRKIFHPEDFAVPEAVKTNKKYFNKKKVWLIAACISILLALFSIISFANDWNVFDFLSEKFGSVHSAPVEDSLEYNGITITNHGKSFLYSNIEEALKSEEIDIIYPTFLPNNITVTDIMLFEDNSKNKLIYIFNEPNLSSEICFNTTLPKSVKKDATEIITVGSITCYICNMPDISLVQVDFEYKGNVYYFSYTDKDTLMEIIENLEEINNENQ